MKFQIRSLFLWALVVFEYLYVFAVGGFKSTDYCDKILRSSNLICSDKMNTQMLQLNSIVCQF